MLKLPDLKSYENRFGQFLGKIKHKSWARLNKKDTVIGWRQPIYPIYHQNHGFSLIRLTSPGHNFKNIDRMIIIKNSEKVPDPIRPFLRFFASSWPATAAVETLTHTRWSQFPRFLNIHHPNMTRQITLRSWWVINFYSWLEFCHGYTRYQHTESVL